MEHLKFLKANCQNCYKCLRECPVKAISIIDHQARIISENCILCGNCVAVCHQNAKCVSSEKEKILNLIKTHQVVATIAPSFVSSFKTDFKTFKKGLLALGFSDAFETAIAAKLVTEKYDEYLKTARPKNLITSCCPSINRLICQYHQPAMKYLAPFDSPMVAHGKMIKKEMPNSKVIFIGPCISKKREAEESAVIDGVLTFENLLEFFKENSIDLSSPSYLSSSRTKEEEKVAAARFYPIPRGIIKSFTEKIDEYEYVAIDGIDRCQKVLENIENIENMFIEMSACEYACINGPCSLIPSGECIMSTEKVRKYANANKSDSPSKNSSQQFDIVSKHNLVGVNLEIPSERKITEILSTFGKFKPEDQLNCGVCGYPSCREKAIAIYNGHAESSMCLPYMRDRAESISVDIIDTTPNGIISVDEDLKILDINKSGKDIFGISENPQGHFLVEYINPTEFVLALASETSMPWKKIHIEKTNKYVEMTIRYLPSQKILYSIMRDITENEQYHKTLLTVKEETLLACDEVIKKQMRVVQEIASLLGETAAETKVALVKLKGTIETK